MRGKAVGVVGAGTMGAAIAELFAFNGIEVRLTDVDRATVDRGVARIRTIVDELVAYHQGRAAKEIERIERLGIALTEPQRAALRAALPARVDRGEAEAILARIRPVPSPSEIGEVDLAIEAVFEDRATKRAVLTALDGVLPEHAVLASNTSSLSVSELARGLAHARSTLVLHFFNPPSTLPLVEVAAGLETREEVVTEAIDFLSGLRNHRAPLLPIRVMESPGFVVNRILLPVLNEACFALEERLASARDIDLALKAGAGFPMGPLELADMVGLDVALAISETLTRETGDPKYRASPLLRRYVAAGWLGRKSGRGFYEYP